MPTYRPESIQLNIIHVQQLSKLPWLVHGFSTRVGGFSKAYGKGSLNLGFTADDSRTAVERNRAAFLSQVGAALKQSDAAAKRKKNQLWPLVTLRQIHSDIIHLIDSPLESPLVGDGLITSTSGLRSPFKLRTAYPSFSWIRSATPSECSMRAGGARSNES